CPVRGAEPVLLLDHDPGQLAPLARQLVPHPGVFLFPLGQLVPGGLPFLAADDLVPRHRVFLLSARSAQAARSVANAAFWRSMALTTPVRHACAIGCVMGSGKMSSSPASTPSNMARATDSGEAFGISKPRVMSVSVGPVRTACTRTPRSASRARS